MIQVSFWSLEHSSVPLNPVQTSLANCGSVGSYTADDIEEVPLMPVIAGPDLSEEQKLISHWPRLRMGTVQLQAAGRFPVLKDR